MSELKNCPFCGGEADLQASHALLESWCTTLDGKKQAGIKGIQKKKKGLKK